MGEKISPKSWEFPKVWDGRGFHLNIRFTKQTTPKILGKGGIKSPICWGWSQLTQTNKSSPNFSKMAALAVAILFGDEVEKRPRVFKERMKLHDICPREENNYRLPQNVLEEITREYANSRYANSTLRSHAIQPETEVSKPICVKYCPWLFKPLVTFTDTITIYIIS